MADGGMGVDELVEAIERHRAHRSASGLPR
jgi:hypothetical protein